MTEQNPRGPVEALAGAIQLIPAGAAILRLRGDIILDVNAGFERVLGHRRADVVGRSASDLGLFADPDERVQLWRRVQERGDVQDDEVRVRDRSGALRHILLSGRAVDLPGGACLLVVFHDITERKQKEAVLSLTDDLTGLNNRRGFVKLAEEQLKLARRAAYRLSLVFMDVDGLKQINDTYGHSAGDAALVGAARILRRVFRESDILARIGGDEFAILAVNAGEESGDAIRARLQGGLEAHNAHASLPYLLSVSVGQLAIDPGTVNNLEELLTAADLAMYAEKLGKRRVANHSIQPPPTTTSPS